MEDGGVLGGVIDVVTIGCITHDDAWSCSSLTKDSIGEIILERRSRNTCESSILRDRTRRDARWYVALAKAKITLTSHTEQHPISGLRAERCNGRNSLDPGSPRKSNRFFASSISACRCHERRLEDQLSSFAGLPVGPAGLPRRGDSQLL